MPSHHWLTSSLVPQVADLVARVTVWQTQGPEQQILLVQQDNLAGAVANVSTGQSQRQFDAALEQLRLPDGETEQINDALTARINGMRTIRVILMPWFRDAWHRTWRVSHPRVSWHRPRHARK